VRARTAAVAALALAALTLPWAAAAHEGGKAEPRIAAAVADEGGLVRVVTVRLTDVDGGEPVPGATVTATAEMTDPHLMRLAPWPLTETEPGVYQARVQFVMPAPWELTIEASGNDVVGATSRLTVDIEPAGAPLGPPISQPAPVGAPPPAGGETPALTLLPTVLEDSVGGRDILTMAVLWLHGGAAVGWIVGVVAMALALSTRPGILAEAFRERLARCYRRWGAWAHWSLVLVIVGTGIYNMLYVTPFPIAWRPGQFDALADVPYGPLYEAILIVKLGLFAALLITGTQVLLRTVRPTASLSEARSGAVRTLAGALGPPGIFYLASVPLIIGAAVALRYIHILSHVAAVVSAS